MTGDVVRCVKNGKLSEDQRWLIGVKDINDTTLYVYNFCKNQYILKEAIQINSSIYDYGISKDHEFIGIGTSNAGMHVYRYDGISFTAYESLKYSFPASISISENHQFYVVTADSSAILFEKLESSWSDFIKLFPS